MVKVIHLSVTEIEDKIRRLEEEKDIEANRTNKTKRKRIYHQLAQLKKALLDPSTLVVDPQEEQKQVEADKAKRIEKKLSKKKELIKEIKKEKRYSKRCLSCGSYEHILNECTQTKGGFCYKCGSTEHSHKECSKETYSLAQCFYCGKTGHIARDCETNEKGLYRMGGSCFGCGSVRHTLKDCPVRNARRIASGQFSNKEEF